MKEKENYQEMQEDTSPATEEMEQSIENETVQTEPPEGNSVLGNEQSESSTVSRTEEGSAEGGNEPETEPELETEPSGDKKDIIERLAEIKDELKRNNDLFESKLLYDAAKEDVITRLHKELQAYKDDMLKKILKPVFMDMILFSDSMRTLGSNYEETPDESEILGKYQKLRKEFLKIGSHIDDVIYNYGVEPYSAKPGEDFNPKTQQVKRDVETASEDEHKKIISSLLPGYTWDEQLLRKEGVSVFVHRENKQKNNSN
jgi:molecular chaperone GrpE